MKKINNGRFNRLLKNFVLFTIFHFFLSAHVHSQTMNAALFIPAEKVKIDVQPIHAWKPPFHLDRVGHSLEAIITINLPELPAGKFEAITYLSHKEINQHALQFSDSTPFLSRNLLPENADEIVLFLTGQDGRRVEFAKQKIMMPAFEFDAVAEAVNVINPIDLGAILVPADWLLIQQGKAAVLHLALISREKKGSASKAVAWYASNPARKISLPLNLVPGKKLLVTLPLPNSNASLLNDTLKVMISANEGQQLAEKNIPVMLVSNPGVRPRFGAVKMKLRYDPPITNIVNGKNQPFSYANAWTPEKEDYVVFLPNKSRWVFWRGSSYIPIWASRFNTGLSYEWAERISPNVGFTDCPEPLMDKELRYGHVEIIESTPSRVHVRWNYQSCDFNYKVNGDYAQEDYYFYPDAMGTRVLTLTSIPEAEYEVAEFILLASQAAVPFDVMPEKPMDIISLRTGRKVEITLPETDTTWRNIGDPGIYRMRLHRKEPMAAFSFNPLLMKKPFAFAPFLDKGEVVTPAYWGGHWPLSQGFNTGRAISESIWSGPSHNSLLTWAAKRPQPLHSQTIVTTDALGATKTMRKETYAWLIGMTDMADLQLLNTAKSFADPASLVLRGATADSTIYVQERRAFCLHTDNAKNISITIQPVEWCVNPVFELTGEKGKVIKVKLGTKLLAGDQYAWDGKTLWVQASFNQTLQLELTFAD